MALLNSLGFLLEAFRAVDQLWGELWDCQLGNLTAGKDSGGGGKFLGNGIESITTTFFDSQLTNDIRSLMEIPSSSEGIPSLSITYLRIGARLVERNAIGRKKRAKDSQWFKDKALLMEAKEKGDILDAEAEAFLADMECTTRYAKPLAITTTTEFGVSQEIHGGEQLDSDVDSVIDDHDNTIPYHQYQLNNEVENDLRSQLEGHIKTNEEQSFANDSLKAELERYKTQVQNLEQKFDKVVKDRTTPLYITNGEWHFEHTKKCFVEEIIPFYEKLKTRVKGIEDNLFKEVSEYMKIFDELDKEYDQCVIDKKSLEIENKNLLIQNECLLAKSVSKDIFSVVLTSNIVVPMSVEPRSNCVEEHSRNLELEAKILKVKQLLVEKEKRCSFTKTKYQELELKFQKYKECFENPQVCNNSSSPELNVFFEINKLKDQLQGKDELLRKLKAQIGNMNEVSADSNPSTLGISRLEYELCR
ncbi:hypothetical protein Tco_1146411 [Tanacetum coccineum]